MHFNSFMTGICDNDLNKKTRIHDRMVCSGELMKKNNIVSPDLVLLFIMTAILMLTTMYRKKDVSYAINTEF